jgi:hypothetical protein
VNNQLVDNCIQILRVFSAQNIPTGLGVNEIFRKTGGKDKKSIIDAIKRLERGQLLESKRSNQHMQIRLKQPTELGVKFIDFMNNIDEYNSACIRFKERVYELLDILYTNDERIIRSKLRQKGWSAEEIDFYNDIAKDGLDIITQFASPSVIINIIVTIYISLLAKIGSHSNESVSEILYHIIMNALSEQFKTLTSEDRLRELYVSRNWVALTNWNIVLGSSVKTMLLEHKFIRKEFEDLIFHVMHTLTPVIKGQRERLIKEMEDQIVKLDQEDKSKAERMRRVLSITEAAYKH